MKCAASSPTSLALRAAPGVVLPGSSAAAGRWWATPFPASVVLLLSGAGIILGLLMPSPEIGAATLGVVPILVKLLWRPGETPILLFAIGFQWLQVSAIVFHSTLLGVPVETLSPAPRAADAVLLGLAALLAVSLGIRTGLRRLPVVGPYLTWPGDAVISIRRLTGLYLVLAVFAWALPTMMWRVLPVAQILLALAELRWVLFFALGQLTLRRRRARWLFFAAFLLEVAAGVGFFSGFKTPIFVALLALLTARPHLTWRNAALGIASAGAVLYLMLAWTAIKGDYREYLNSGSRQQLVLVSRSDRLATFANSMRAVGLQELGASVDPLLSRLAYVEFLARVLDYVPAHRPHAHGDLWLKSLAHVATPRVLFPDKAVLPSSSELTMEYTGLQLASGRQGTSISMGYVAESYIDFGFYGIWVPLLLLGIGWGYMYRHCLRHAGRGAIGYGFATTLLLNAYQFEMSGIMLLGGVLMKFLVFAMIIHLGLPYVESWLRAGSQPARLLASQVEG